MLKKTDTRHARQFIEMISATTQEECREMGQQMLGLASTPRDHQWSMMMQIALDAIPAAPVSDLAQAIAAGNARVRAHNDELWRQGWHPIQMRKKLEELGYKGTATTTAPEDGIAYPVVDDSEAGDA